MKPSIGRVVHYHPNLESGALATRAAIVTGVDEEDETRVDLTVFPPRADPYREVLVPFSPEPRPGHWTWPPRV
jgi:hypothetical protein